MEVEIIEMSSPDIDIYTFNPYDDPDDPDNRYPNRLHITIEMVIGAEGKGLDYWIDIYTTEYLARFSPCPYDKILVINEWNLELITNELNKIVKMCIDAPEDTYKALSRYFHWEYENYIPYEEALKRAKAKSLLLQ